MTYEYQCKHCLKIEEINIPIKDYTSTIPCPICNRVMDRVFTPIPFKFSGLSTGTTLTPEGKIKAKQPTGTVSFDEGKQLARNANDDTKNKYKLSKSDEKFIRSVGI